MKWFLFFNVIGCLIFPCRGVEKNFSSGTTRVSLIELFSSEGCSSCPSAERWLGTLRDAPGLWRDFVPLAFHVNYWDRLGWPDRFASGEATQREYAYAAAWNSASVYTPCFVRNGSEWRAAEKNLAPSKDQVGGLSFTINEAKMCRVEFKPAKSGDGQNFEVHVALLGGGFSSRVTAGENRGETLRHEFVVLAWSTHALTASADGTHCLAEIPLPNSKIVDGPRRAIAAWVTRRGDLVPLQATGGWLDARPSGKE